MGLVDNLDSGQVRRGPGLKQLVKPPFPAERFVSKGLAQALTVEYDSTPFYADDVRKNLRLVRRNIKDLSDKRTAALVLRSKRMKLFERIVVNGQYGSGKIDIHGIAQQINSLGRTATDLQEEIEQQRRRCGELEQMLSTAPTKPRSRSMVASIAASGSKEINAKAAELKGTSTRRGRETSEEIVWIVGMSAARATAKNRYELDAVPEQSIEIMKRTLIKHFPKATRSFRTARLKVDTSIVSASK